MEIIRILKVDNRERTIYGVWNGSEDVPGAREVKRFNLTPNSYAKKTSCYDTIMQASFQQLQASTILRITISN